MTQANSNNPHIIQWFLVLSIYDGEKDIASHYIVESYTSKEAVDSSLLKYKERYKEDRNTRFSVIYLDHVHTQKILQAYQQLIKKEQQK